jgi:urease accessory protein
MGAALGAGGFFLPGVETVIDFSVTALGAMVASGITLPTGLAIGLAGVFAVFHGHAHGTALAQLGAPGLAYGLSFIAATALLHVSGIILYRGLQMVSPNRVHSTTRVLGALIAVAGAALVTGLA